MKPLSKRDKYLEKKYGITQSQYSLLLKSQGGGCAICGKTSDQEGRSLAVDHNHFTGEIRGILCAYCNHRRVGRARDPGILRRIADYISQGTGWFVPKVKTKKRKRKKK